MTYFCACECASLRRSLQIPLVTDRELGCADFRRMIRRSAAMAGLPATQWRKALTDYYRDFPGRIVGPDHQEVFLDMEVFEIENDREWFRDLCRPVRKDACLRLRRESMERLRVVATLIRAGFVAHLLIAER